jgi:hypothetical protein
MRVFTILLFYLLIQLSNLQGATESCLCECCTTPNCAPTLVGTHPLWFCTETKTCTHSSCVQWHPDVCPRRDGFGQTRSICESYAERILPTSLILIGINLMILLLKDKF